jgi:hypothetical protein
MMQIRKPISVYLAGVLYILMSSNQSLAGQHKGNAVIEGRVTELLGRMTVAEKIGQMSQVNADGDKIPGELRAALKAGRIGSILNQVNVDLVNEMQRIAVEESRLDSQPGQCRRRQ